MFTLPMLGSPTIPVFRAIAVVLRKPRAPLWPRNANRPAFGAHWPPKKPLLHWVGVAAMYRPACEWSERAAFTAALLNLVLQQDAVACMMRRIELLQKLKPAAA